ncbi:aspartate carbamoyltransferase catalytic subunit [Roseivivax sp. CAU 1753]
MTTIDIRAAETGVTRLFHIDLPAEAVERFTTQAGTGEWPLPYALGATKLRPSFVEVVSIRDLGDMPLSRYLAEAHDIRDPDFAKAQPQIDALKGHVIVLPSQAFAQTAQTLTVAAPLRWIGTFSEAESETTSTPIVTESARRSGPAVAPPVDPLTDNGGSPLLRALVIAATALTVGILIYVFVG